MTAWQNILVLLILFGLFLLIYTKIRNQSLKQTFEEIFELFKMEDKIK